MLVQPNQLLMLYFFLQITSLLIDIIQHAFVVSVWCLET